MSDVIRDALLDLADGLGAAPEVLARLRDDPAVMEQYLEIVMLDTLLADRFAGQRAVLSDLARGPQPPPAKPRRGARFAWPIVRIAAAAAVVVAFVGLIATFLSHSTRPNVHRPAVATLVDAADAVWGESDVPTTPGSQLPGGTLRLQSGTAHIEFFSGAKVTLIGPAEFGLNAEKRAFLRRGKLAAYCPPEARGFTLGAPGLVVVDLGTEFELDVDASQNAELRVIRGLVETSRTDGQTGQVVTRRLAEHQAMHVRNGQATVERIIGVAVDPASDLVWIRQFGSLPPEQRPAWRRVGVVGSSYSEEGRHGSALVLAFALPVLDPAAPIRDADLQFTFAKTPASVGPLHFNLDLHFLGASDRPEPMTRYYFAGPAAQASSDGAVPIQLSVITPATPDGAVHLSPDARAVLIQHLQSLYQPDGRPRQAFVVLRLNPDAPMPTSRSAPLVGYEIVFPRPGDRLNVPTLWIRQ